MKHIVITGIDGCGKSTVISEVCKELSSYEGMYTKIKHPSKETPLGRSVVEITTNFNPINDLSHRYMFMADMIETYALINKKSLHIESKGFIFDRHVLTDNIAYGEANGSNITDLLMLSIDFIKTHKTPDLIVYLDVPIALAYERMLDREKEPTVIEKRGYKYFEKVRKNFLNLGKFYEKAGIDINYLIIDNENRTVKDVAFDIVKNIINLEEKKNE
ncbi:MAG: dTMP kinase [bacterium]